MASPESRSGIDREAAGTTVSSGVDRLASDGFVAYPTETVWGLAASAKRPLGVRRLIEWKGRAGDAPMSVLVSSIEEALSIGCDLDAPARNLVGAFWPGPLTLVVPCRSRFAEGVAREDGALGLRCSPHPVARALCEAAREAGLSPLTSTSFNRTGEAPVADIQIALDLLEAGDPRTLEAPGLVFVDGEDAGGAAPSSVVDCTGPEPAILREGAIDASALEAAWQTPGADTP